MAVSSGTVGARLEAFSESATKLNAGLADALSQLERLQQHTTVLTVADGPVTLDSFAIQPGSPEQRLLDALAMRRTLGSVIERYAQFLLSIGRGDAGDQVEKQRHLLESAAEDLKAFLPEEPAAVASADAQLAAATAAAGIGGQRPAIERLEAAGGHARFALGMVAKMASDSTPGKLAGLVGMISDKVTGHVRVEHGVELLASLLPKLQGDVASLCQAIVAGQEPLTASAKELAQRVIDWTNGHLPNAGDPARLSYNAELADLLSHARQIATLTQHAAAAAAQLPAAHEEIGKMAADVPTDGEALKALVKSAEQLARRRR